MLHQENANENHKRYSHLPRKRLKLKYLKTTGISTDMRKPESSYSVGEKVTSYHQFGRGKGDHNILFDVWGPKAGGGRERVPASHASGVAYLTCPEKGKFNGLSSNTTLLSELQFP